VELFKVLPPAGATGTLCSATSRQNEVLSDIVKPPADEADMDVANATCVDVADNSETITDSRDSCFWIAVLKIGPVAMLGIFAGCFSLAEQVVEADCLVLRTACRRLALPAFCASTSRNATECQKLSL
jgi:hypothetical protein